MTLILEPQIESFFSKDKDLFDQIMAMQGQVYRELEGRRTQRVIINGQAYFLKQHFGVGWKEIFKNLLQLRLPVLGAENEWKAIQKLEALNIATMHVAGFGKRGINPAHAKSFLITNELTHVISLEDFCQHWKITPPSSSLKYNLIKAVAKIASTLHEHGVNHRDFYICHFLLRTDCSSPVLYLIDLHRAQTRSRTPARWVIKDLAGLYFSSKDIGLTTRDLWRFIRAYRQQPLRQVIKQEGQFWQKVKQRGDKLYEQHAK